MRNQRDIHRNFAIINVDMLFVAGIEGHTAVIELCACAALAAFKGPISIGRVTHSRSERVVRG
jgi:hypothetical protein